VQITLLLIEALQTMIAEVEAERPPTNTSSDLCDPQPLTPAHLLYGRAIT